METFKITTDETLRETIQHGNNRYPFAYYPDNIWKFDFHRIDWHWHHELEFLYTAEGTALCLIGTSKIELHKGCGIFINSGVLHRFEAQSSTFTPNIVFSPTLLAPENSLIYEKYILPVISSSVPYQVFSPSNTFGKQVLQLLSQICTIQETKPDNELCTIQLLFQLWNILQKNMDWTSDSNSIHRLNHKQARLQAMMQYIHDHYMEEITLETIAASASISKSGALHIFQTGIHCSPVAYLIQYRLAQAAEQLYITQKSVSSIAEETGFTSSGYFCRKFRQCLTIKRSIRYDGTKHKNVIGTTKRKKVRIVDFGDTLTEILKAARREQLKSRMQYGELYHRNYYKEVHVKNRVYYEYYHLDGTQEVPADYKEISFVCLRPDGSLELPSTLGIACRSVSKKLEGFEDFHFHQLRHTYTSNLLSNGAAPKDVQELLGHSDVSTTMNIYAHSTRKAKRDSARLLDKVASNA